MCKIVEVVVIVSFMILASITFVASPVAGLAMNIDGYGFYDDRLPAYFDHLNITNTRTGVEWNDTYLAVGHPQIILYQNYYILYLDEPTDIQKNDILMYYAVNGTLTNTSHETYAETILRHNIRHNITFMTAASGIANHVVISEVQVEGVTANDEFVELYNPTTAPISLSGWHLTKKTSGDTEQNLLAGIPAGKSIQARGFFLITPRSEDYTGSSTPDANYSQSSHFIAADNTVILYNESKTAVIDKVGFGDAADNETESYPANPTDNKSLQRKVNATLNESGSYGPAWDTDNNSADFFIQANPNPQNSSAEPVPPIPEFNTLILVSMGLIALTGYVLLKRRGNLYKK